jgi:hypothetical protein
VDGGHPVAASPTGTFGAWTEDEATAATLRADGGNTVEQTLALRTVDLSSMHGSGDTGTGMPNMSDEDESLTVTTRSDRMAVFGATFTGNDFSSEEGMSPPVRAVGARHATPLTYGQRLAPEDYALAVQMEEDGWLPPVPFDPKPDGPRYAAMGDAVTVNVIEWIGVRLRAAVEAETTNAP